MVTREILARLLAFDTVSSRPNMALIRDVQGLLDAAGIASVLVPDAGGGKANLYDTVGPEGRGGVMLSDHTDVVPVEGQDWTKPPFALTEEGGRYYGRGAADMKGFVACAIAAMLDAARRPLKVPLHLALSYDEEIGCMGVRSLIDMLEGAPVRPRFCIVGEPTGMQVATGHKGKIALRATDFRGYRVLCSSILPIDPTTICYGSSDAGKTFHSDPEAEALSDMAAAKLNLKKHKFKNFEISAPVDVEAHHGHDGRMYCVDLARLFPPEAPNLALEAHPRAMFFRLLRPELVRLLPAPLSSDAFTAFGIDNASEHNAEVEAATRHLQTVLIPNFSKLLYSMGSSVNSFSSLVSQAHKNGINLRMGMPLYLHQPPTGYKDTAEEWISTSALLERMNFALDLSGGRVRGVRLAQGAAGLDTRTIEGVAARLVPGGLSENSKKTLEAEARKEGSEPMRVVGLVLGSPEFQRR